MKFTIVSHACLLVEHQGVRLLTDPWVRGSCYWRSWWNFPEPDATLVDSLKPDYIYITHLHWDHFHGDLLKHFPKETKILIPATSASRFRKDLEYLGFTNIQEVRHGSTVTLGKDFSLTSYQFGICADSAIVIQAAE